MAGNNVVYRIKDELYYAVTMEEWNGTKWVQYQGEDVQVEFVMLDPYVRKTLSLGNSGLNVEEATHSTVRDDNDDNENENENENDKQLTSPSLSFLITRLLRLLMYMVFINSVCSTNVMVCLLLTR